MAFEGKGGFSATYGSRFQTGTKGAQHPSQHYYRPPEPSDEPGVLAFVEDLLDRARRRDYPWQALYYLVAANFVGRQWATFNPRRRALEEPIVPAKKVLLTFNQILPMVLREASKLSLGRIPWTVVPTGIDEEHISAARMDGKLLDHYWEVNSMRRVEAQMNLTRTMFGMAYIEPDWDLTQGRMIHPGMKDAGNSENRKLPEFEGAATVRVRTPFNVHHDQDATEPDELRWISVTTMTDVGKLRLMYDRGREIIPEQPDEQTYLEHRMQYLSSHYFQAFTARGDYDRFPHHARYSKIWFYPDDEWPLGREVHKAGNVVLYDGEWRHKYLTTGSKRRHPLIPVYYTQVPLRFRGQGMVENLLEPQWEYNKKRSQMVQILNRMAKPKWTASKGHKMAHAPDDEPGEVLVYTIDPISPKAKPEPVLPSVPTGDFEAHFARTMSDMQNTASQHEVSYGRTPPGVSAGVAIEQLIAQDDAAKGMPMQDAIVALQDVGYSVLGMYRQYGQEEQVLSIAGRDYQHEFYTWKKSMSDPFARVQIISDGSMPATRGQKREMVKELVALTILDPINDRNKILQYLEFGQLEEVFHQINQDITIAKRENQEMLDTDTLPAVQMEDDHEVHIREHSEFVKARREIDPITAATMRTHIHQHLFFKGMMQQQTATLMGEAMAPPFEEVAARTGDDIPPEEQEEGAQPVRPESGALGKQTKPKQSGTPGNKMRDRKNTQRQ